MMDWTDRHCRYFHRLLTKRARLFTEMVVADAVIHGDRDYLLGYDEVEHEVALQIGGSDPDKMAKAAKVGEEFGYDEININVGCPSDRVQSGRFGACLMAVPGLVADCFKAMQDHVDIPVTVKCRLGIDDQDLSQTLPDFLQKVSDAGCQEVTIHARKAWLKGLSPKENRDVPPLDYALVREMKAAFPHLTIFLNGGLTTLDQALEEGDTLDGAMFGRAAYHDPWMLSDVDRKIFGQTNPATERDSVMEELIRYAESCEDEDRSTKALLRHIMGLYAGLPGARRFRQILSEAPAKKLKPSEALRAALASRSEYDQAA